MPSLSSDDNTNISFPMISALYQMLMDEHTSPRPSYWLPSTFWWSSTNLASYWLLSTFW